MASRDQTSERSSLAESRCLPSPTSVIHERNPANDDAMRIYGSQCTHCRKECHIQSFPLSSAFFPTIKIEEAQQIYPSNLQDNDLRDNYIVLCSTCFADMQIHKPQLIAVPKHLEDVVARERERVTSGRLDTCTTEQYMTTIGEEGLLYKIEFISCDKKQLKVNSYGGGRSQFIQSLSHANVITLTRNAAVSAIANVFFSIGAPDMYNQLLELHVLWLLQFQHRTKKIGPEHLLCPPRARPRISPKAPAPAPSTLEHIKNLRQRASLFSANKKTLRSKSSNSMVSSQFEVEERSTSQLAVTQLYNKSVSSEKISAPPQSVEDVDLEEEVPVILPNYWTESQILSWLSSMN